MLKCSEVVKKADALLDDETLGFGEHLSLRAHGAELERMLADSGGKK